MAEDSYEEEKISNDGSLRGSMHFEGGKPGTPMNASSGNYGSHTKIPSHFNSSHKKQHSPMIGGPMDNLIEEGAPESEEGGLRWNLLKQDLTLKK